MAERKIRIVLADDQFLFAESLQTVLETYTEDMEIIGIAKDGAEAIEIVRRTRPDVVLMDVRMPVLDGVRACSGIHKELPEIRIIMLTTFDDDDDVYEALRHGATGYLLKDIPRADLIAAIYAVNEGVVSISPSIAKQLVTEHSDRASQAAKERGSDPSRLKEAAYWIDRLTKREKDILRLIADGKENHEIALSLCIAEQTVKNNTSLIYATLGVNNRIQAMQLYLKYRDAAAVRDPSALADRPDSGIRVPYRRTE
jgi:DNA-binding NarL/FixJ family response regulator